MQAIKSQVGLTYYFIYYNEGGKTGNFIKPIPLDLKTQKVVFNQLFRPNSFIPVIAKIVFVSNLNKIGDQFRPFSRGTEIATL